MSAWRAAGLNYVNYSNIAARLLRKALKPELRADAAKREESTVRFTPWKDGKSQKKGKFLALDLGGSTFRVLVVDLDEGKFEMESKIYAIPLEKMTGRVNELFDHIATCLSDFIHEKKLHDQNLPLGFTFNFPVRQVSLDSAIIQRFTKGFNIVDGEGKDVVELLKAALDRRQDIKVNVCAVLNDTVGTLMSCAWKNQTCKIGLIIGTGTNTCYVERVENVEMFESKTNKSYVIINTENPAFGEDGKLEFVLTEFDKEVDSNSINKGQQIYEKMISSMYLGELVRLIVLKLIKENEMFGGNSSDLFNTQYLFDTKYMSDIESEEAGKWDRMSMILMGLDMGHGNEQDFVNLRYIVEVLSQRAAALVSACMVALINKMDFNPVTIGVDGTLYKQHPNFRPMMLEYIGKFVKKGIKFELMLSEDGSGRGAALVAAAAIRARSEQLAATSKP
uniref:Phosphotransferase n=1 Tax=Timema tahoe TaxID=61484 RepID=A0A7R9FKL7_9NEOP|nr:unnamed protein product [Timema tahoe]